MFTVLAPSCAIRYRSQRNALAKAQIDIATFMPVTMQRLPTSCHLGFTVISILEQTACAQWQPEQSADAHTAGMRLTSGFAEWEASQIRLA